MPRFLLPAIDGNLPLKWTHAEPHPPMACASPADEADKCAAAAGVRIQELEEAMGSAAAEHETAAAAAQAEIAEAAAALEVRLLRMDGLQASGLVAAVVVLTLGLAVDGQGGGQAGGQEGRG